MVASLGWGESTNVAVSPTAGSRGVSGEGREELQLSQAELARSLLGQQSITAEKEILGPDCVLLGSRKPRIYEGNSWTAKSISANTLFYKVLNSLTTLAKENTMNLEQDYSLQSGEISVLNCAAGHAYLRFAEAEEGEFERLMQSYPDYLIMTDLTLLKPLTSRHVWCKTRNPILAISTPSCSRMLQNKTAELSIPFRDIPTLASEAKGTISYVLASRSGLTTRADRRLICRKYESDKEILVADLTSQLMDLRVNIQRLDKSLKIGIWDGITNRLSNCGVQYSEDSLVLGEQLQKLYRCAENQTPGERAKRSMSIIDMASNDLAEVLPQINDNFEALKIGLENLQEASLANQAGNQIDLQNTAHLAKDMGIFKLRLFALEMDTLEQSRLTAHQKGSKDLLSLMINELKATKEYLEEMEQIVTDMATHFDHHCKSLTCSVPSKTTIAINEGGIIAFSKTDNVDTARSFILSCKADENGMILKGNWKGVTNLTEEEVTQKLRGQDKKLRGQDKKLRHPVHCLQNLEECDRSQKRNVTQGETVDGNLYIYPNQLGLAYQCLRERDFLVYTLEGQEETVAKCDIVPRQLQLPAKLASSGLEIPADFGADISSVISFPQKQSTINEALQPDKDRVGLWYVRHTTHSLAAVFSQTWNLLRSPNINAVHVGSSIGGGLLLSGVLGACTSCCGVYAYQKQKTTNDEEDDSGSDTDSNSDSGCCGKKPKTTGCCGKNNKKGPKESNKDWKSWWNCCRKKEIPEGDGPKQNSSETSMNSLEFAEENRKMEENYYKDLTRSIQERRESQFWQSPNEKKRRRKQAERLDRERQKRGLGLLSPPPTGEESRNCEGNPSQSASSLQPGGIVASAPPLPEGKAGDCYPI